MHVRKTAVLFSLLVSLAAASASATTINFASLQGNSPDPALPGALMAGTSFTQQGFSIASVGGRFDVWQLGNSNFPGPSTASTSLFEFSAGSETLITYNGSQPFTLDSIDFAPLLSGGSGPFTILVTGDFGDGSFVTQTVTISNSPGLQTVRFSGFTNVIAVNIIQGTNAGYFTGQETAYQFNNIVVNNRYVNGLRFVPVAPCRVADTRNPAGAFGAPYIGPTGADGQTRSFAIPNSSCGIPSTAQAYSFNVTVVPHGSLGFITVWPTGVAQPLVSTLNSLDGRIKANAAIVPAGTSGAISVFATNDTDLVLDVNGYFVPAATPSALAFYPMTPCRLVDTRVNLLSSGALAADTSRTLPILSSTCNVPATAQAYSLNFTVVPTGPIGYLSVWPTGQSQPLVSTLNDLTGTIVANAAIVPAGTAGDVDVYATNTTDLVVDINGYFAPPGTGGLSLYNLPPCRVLDTRTEAGAFSGELSPPVNVVGSQCAPPSTAQTYVFNATVVPQGGLGYLTLWPDGQSQPVVSTLNALDGSITSNMAIVPTTNGSVDAFAAGTTNLILDLPSYFAP